MKDHECLHEGFLGEVKEFIANSKGLKATMFTIALAILLQIGTFLYLWGDLTRLVKTHDTTIASLDKKLDSIRYIGYAYADGENGR